MSLLGRKSSKPVAPAALTAAFNDTVQRELAQRSDRNSPEAWLWSAKTCQKLWERIPAAFRTGHCFTDFWEAYQKVLPDEQHTACGKETGQTAHVERWNNTLRQRLARFVRKTLSFSKSEEMHELCLRLFLHRYNLSLVSSD